MNNDFAIPYLTTVLNFKSNDLLGNTRVFNIEGEWGIGKTHFLNEIEAQNKNTVIPLLDECNDYSILRINPWIDYVVNEDIEYSFLRQINAAAKKDNSLTFLKSHLRRLKLSHGGSEVGLISHFLSMFINEDTKSISNEIGEHLKRRKYKLIIAIDDVDRLDAKEIKELFKFLMHYGNIENISYVLLFDRQRVLSEIGEEDNYLDKIIVHTYNIKNSFNIVQEFKRDKVVDSNKKINSYKDFLNLNRDIILNPTCSKLLILVNLNYRDFYKLNDSFIFDYNLLYNMNGYNEKFTDLSSYIIFSIIEKIFPELYSLMKTNSSSIKHSKDISKISVSLHTLIKTLNFSKSKLEQYEVIINCLNNYFVSGDFILSFFKEIDIELIESIKNQKITVESIESGGILNSYIDIELGKRTRFAMRLLDFIKKPNITPTREQELYSDKVKSLLKKDDNKIIINILRDLGRSRENNDEDRIIKPLLKNISQLLTLEECKYIAKDSGITVSAKIYLLKEVINLRGEEEKIEDIAMNTFYNQIENFNYFNNEEEFLNPVFLAYTTTGGFLISLHELIKSILETTKENRKTFFTSYIKNIDEYRKKEDIEKFSKIFKKQIPENIKRQKEFIKFLANNKDTSELLVKSVIENYAFYENGNPDLEYIYGASEVLIFDIFKKSCEDGLTE